MPRFRRRRCHFPASVFLEKKRRPTLEHLLYIASWLLLYRVALSGSACGKFINLVVAFSALCRKLSEIAFNLTPDFAYGNSKDALAPLNEINDFVV